MTIDDETDLRARTAALPLDWQRSAFTGDSPESYPPLIEAAAIVADEARMTVSRWVGAARRGGVGWAEIGAILGTSKQAAQQRFGGGSDDEDAPAGALVTRLGATAFNEMAMLAKEGEAGRELIATGALRLYFRQTNRRWGYLRTVGPIDPALQAEQGWQAVSTWFVFHYYKRTV